MSPLPKTILLICALVLATPLWGQVSTGRHRPVTADPDERPGGGEFFAEPRWFFMAGAGVMASGTLFQMRCVDPVNWRSPRGSVFYSKDFVVMLDEDLDLAMTLGRRLGARSWLRLNLSTARMNMRARARVGQEAKFYPWDQMDIVVLGLDLEYRLVALQRYPYVLLGGAGVAVRGGGDSAIDQTRPALRFGAGYNLSLNQTWGLRGEIRNNLVSLDLSKLDPVIAFGEQPAGPTVDNKSPHQFWEILIQFIGSF